MLANGFSKRDQLLFRERIAGWQEAYIGRLNREYIGLFSRDGPEAEKLWVLYAGKIIRPAYIGVKPTQEYVSIENR